jgi:hypothetical protein
VIAAAVVAGLDLGAVAALVIADIRARSRRAGGAR